jgi:fumarylacetoacetate (FAA) hydrolase family protein
MPITNAFDLVRGNNFTVVVVEKRKSSKQNNFFLGGTTGARNANLVLGNVVSNVMRFAFFANDIDGQTPNYQQSLEQTRVLVFEKTPTGRAIYLNGQQLNRDSNREILSGWNGAAIGRFGGDFYQGILYEVLIFNPGLSPDRRQKIEGYLAHKWGIPMNLSAGHPFKNSAP